MLVGYAYTRNTEVPHAFVWHSNSGIIDIHPHGETGWSKASAINNQGHVVGTIEWGEASQNTQAQTAFVWDPALGMSFLQTPGSISTAQDINDQGYIVGSYRNCPNSCSTSFLTNRQNQLKILGSGKAVAINNHNHAVGDDDTETPSAILWKDGKAVSLNKVVERGIGYHLRQATGINDKGEIIGVAVKADERAVQHGFLLKPKAKPLFVVDEELHYKCIVLPLDNSKSPYPQKRFVTVPGEIVNTLNAAETVWCQPLDMVDFDRLGEVKYDHYKMYEVIAVYLGGANGRTLTSYDFLDKNRTKTAITVRTGGVYSVPGYFLNDWNNRVNPSTGEVYFWFQPTDILPPGIKGKIIRHHQGKIQ